MEQFIQFGYIIASALFIIGLKMMGKIPTAKNGNRLSAVGMLLALVITLLYSGMDYTWIIAGLAIGTIIGAWMALGVKMTQMPEMVGLMNGLGGMASMLVGWAEYQKIVQEGGWEVYATHSATSPYFTAAVIFIAIFIGAVTFTGSLFAFGKLSGIVSGKPMKVPGLRPLTNLLYLVIAVGLVAFCASAGVEALAPYAMTIFISAVVISLLMGLFIVMPIGGGDMPVVIAMLNSFSGLAACASGFAIQNTLLIVAGCLVGVSGVVLSVIMCKAMNRTLAEVFIGGFGGDAPALDESSSTDEIKGELKPINAEDAYYLFEAARNVVIVPGYGMAVAQAQHAIKELAGILEENGAEVRFAIHPVAGRMPGHMNVLLAEADVSYDQLWEMDAINPQLPSADLALVVGANDVVNPAASMDKSSPLYGMPIINVHQARTVICMKRGKGAGFSGLENKLFLLPNSRMLYGDAKNTVNGLVSQFKQANS